MGSQRILPESATKRIYREAKGRVRTNVFLRDMDLAMPGVDGRRLEVVVDGLPLRGRSQLAMDTTLVCTLRERRSNIKRTGGLPESAGACPSEGRDSFDETPDRTGMETALGCHLRVCSCESCRFFVEHAGLTW